MIVHPSGSDDTASLQSAIDSLVAGRGGTLELAPGEYTISAPLTLSPGAKQNQVGIRGAGVGSFQWTESGHPGHATTVIRNVGNDDAIRYSGTGPALLADFAILDGMQPQLASNAREIVGAPRTTGHAIHTGGGLGCLHMERVYTHGHVDGVHAERCMVSSLVGVVTQSPMRHGFHVLGGTSARMSSCYSRAAGQVLSAGVPVVADGGDGFHFGAAVYSSLDACASDYSRRHGYHVTGHGGRWCEGVALTACGAEGTGADGFRLDSPRGAVLTAPYVANAGRCGVSLRTAYSTLIQCATVLQAPIGIESTEQPGREIVVMLPRFSGVATHTNWPSGEGSIDNGVEIVGGGETSLIGLQLRGGSWAKTDLSHDPAAGLSWTKE